MQSKRIYLAACTTGTILLLLAATYALVIVHPNDKPFKNDSLPKVVVKLANRYRRVYGRTRYDFGDWKETQLFFKGDTGQLNEFLRGLAKVKDAWLYVTLFPEPGQYEPRWQGRWLSYNWCLDIDERRPVARKGREQTTKEASSRPHQRKGTKWDIFVLVSVHGDIDLGKIQLPLAYGASVGGRLCDFVEGHNDRVKEAASKKPSERDNRPTTEKLLQSYQGLGGDPESAAEALKKIEQKHPKTAPTRPAKSS